MKKKLQVGKKTERKQKLRIKATLKIIWYKEPTKCQDPYYLVEWLSNVNEIKVGGNSPIVELENYPPFIF